MQSVRTWNAWNQLEYKVEVSLTIAQMQLHPEQSYNARHWAVQEMMDDLSLEEILAILTESLEAEGIDVDSVEVAA